LVLALAGVALSLLLMPPLAAAQQGAPLTSESSARYDPDLWDIARGGQLYDNWALALDRELPGESHPSYPPVGRREGGTTWRCKECHGWDYMGEDGAYVRISSASSPTRPTATPPKCFRSPRCASWHCS
jgi:thiosulfate dehydrogenase